MTDFFVTYGVKSLDLVAIMEENDHLYGGVPERSKGSDCKSDGSAFEGSNPSPSTSRQIIKIIDHRDR